MMSLQVDMAAATSGPHYDPGQDVTLRLEFLTARQTRVSSLDLLCAQSLLPHSVSSHAISLYVSQMALISDIPLLIQAVTDHKSAAN